MIGTPTMIPNRYVGDGVSTSFLFTFPCRVLTDVSVILTDLGGNDTPQTSPSQYTITGTKDAHSGLYTGGSIAFVTAPTLGYGITILRNAPATQNQAFNQGDSLPYNSIEAALDAVVLEVQQILYKIGRTFTLPDTENPSFSMQLLNAVSRANKIMGFDSMGVPALVTSIGSWGGNWVTNTFYAFQTILKDPVTGNVYFALTNYTSSASIATDVSNGNLVLLIQAPTVTYTTLGTYSDDGGSAANIYVTTLNPAPGSLVKGLRVTSVVGHTNTGPSTLNTNALGAKNIKLVNGTDPLAGNLTAGMLADFEYDGTQFILQNPYLVSSATNASINPARTEAKLTALTGVPNPVTDQLAVTSVLLTPLNGSKIALFSSGSWGEYTLTEQTLSASGKTAGAVYDVFAFSNAGTPNIEWSAAWTTPGAGGPAVRSDALALLNGVWVKSSDHTRKWVGTVAMTGTTGQTEDSVKFRGIWNVYNMIEKILQSPLETTANWTYSVATWRQARASATNQVQLVVGLAAEPFKCRVQGGASSTGAAGAAFFGVGIGVNVTNANSAQRMWGESLNYANSAINLLAYYSGYLPIGLNTIAWLEKGLTSGITWYGQNGDTQMGLTAETRM